MRVSSHAILWLLGSFVRIFLQLRRTNASGTSEGFTVFGYLPEYRLKNFDYEGAFQTGLTHLIYFSLEIDTERYVPSALDRLPSPQDLEKAKEAAKKVNGKIMLSFGGNARSQGFSNMVAKRKRRLHFLKSLNKFLTEQDLHGVDYNWEYPKNAMEWKNWGKLMKESKEMLLGGKNVVSFTMYNDPNHFKVIQAFDLLSHADYLHCMVYDMRGEHSTVAFARHALELAKDAELKMDYSKWTLGLPFYGRNVHTGEAKAFSELKPRNNVSNMEHDVFYNSQETLATKVRMAMDEGVGGVMIWELGQDKQPFARPESLLWAVHSALPAVTDFVPAAAEEGKEVSATFTAPSSITNAAAEGMQNQGEGPLAEEKGDGEVQLGVSEIHDEI